MAKSMRPSMLTIDLIGRICLVWKKEQAWAVFLKAGKDPKFHTRRSHMAALNLPLGRVKQQSVADRSKMVIGTVRRAGKSLADSMGVWSLADCDMHLLGVKGDGTVAPRPRHLANLNKIVDSVRPGSQFNYGIWTMTHGPTALWLA